jgi:hypothetical protein
LCSLTTSRKQRYGLSATLTAAAEVFIITSPTGVRESFLAQALNLQDCMMGDGTQYYDAHKLLPPLRRLHRKGECKHFIDRPPKTSVLILDDFGLELRNPRTASVSSRSSSTGPKKGGRYHRQPGTGLVVA